tara:strand:- start:84 stop:347 length:264 start_codon:yes stop_codon:yes gene_type:complete
MNHKMKKAVKAQDIEQVLWQLCVEALEDFDLSNNCKIGKQTFSNLLSTLSQMEMLKRRKSDKQWESDQKQELQDLDGWIGLRVVDGK